jgi:hypothetical protein
MGENRGHAVPSTTHGDVLNEYWARLSSERPDFQFALVGDDERSARGAAPSRFVARTAAPNGRGRSSRRQRGRLWAEKARTEVARLGAAHDPEALSPSEARVASLAATRLTNREIATTALMSQQTVEVNLSRIGSPVSVRAPSSASRLVELQRL